MKVRKTNMNSRATNSTVPVATHKGEPEWACNVAEDNTKLPYMMFDGLQQKHAPHFPSMANPAAHVPDAFGNVRHPAKFAGQLSLEQIRKRGVVTALFF